jgi:electron transfer flavoprotein alpha subunit
MAGILVFAEQRDNKVKRGAMEALGAAKILSAKLGGGVTAALLGESVAEEAKGLAAAGAEKVFLAEDSTLHLYGSEAYATLMAEIANRVEPAVILMPASAMGKDLGPKLAARLKSSLATDCVALEVDDQGILTATRPIYAGKARAKVSGRGPKFQIATLRPNVFTPPSPDTTKAPVIERVPVKLDFSSLAAKIREIVAAAGSKVELTEATIIVSGGRGLKGPENFKMIEELAEVLGAAVGASRAAVDAGWKPHSYQVGLTGKTVSPLLYIACGISGAIQHQAGMSSSKYIVAINKDPNAPIFKIASYGIVGDVFEVVPLLTQAIRNLKAEG